MLKKIYKKDGKIIIYNEKLINSLDDIIKNFYISKGYDY